MPSLSQPSTRKRRTFAPVASSSLPNFSASSPGSFAIRSPASIFMTLLRVRTSTFSSSHSDWDFQSASSFVSLPAR